MSEKSVNIFSMRLYRSGVQSPLTLSQSGIDFAFQLYASIDISNCIKFNLCEICTT